LQRARQILGGAEWNNYSHKKAFYSTLARLRQLQQKHEDSIAQYNEELARYNAELENRQLGSFSDDDYDPEVSADESYSVCSVYWLTFY
jgi:hypothetical protein